MKPLTLGDALGTVPPATPAPSPGLRPKARAFLKSTAHRTLRAAQAIDQSCSRLSQATLVGLAFGMILVVVTLDYATPPALSFTVFYLLPVMFVTWWSNRRAGLLTSAACTLAWMLTETLNPAGIPNSIIVTNALFRFSIFAFVVLLLAHIRALQASLQQSLAKRTRQLDEETARRLAIERQLALVSHREQQRIAHELHDGLGQELGALAFQAKLLAGKLAEHGITLSADAERLVSILNMSISRTRALSRLLDPISSESGGLRAALGQLADDSGQAFLIACTFESPAVLPDLPTDTQLHLYRIAQEAIHNAVQHGRASVVTLRAALEPEALRLEVADNGAGFAVPDARATRRGGMGLRIMRHRAALLAAQLQVASEPGTGCRVTCVLPLPRAVQLSLAHTHA